MPTDQVTAPSNAIYSLDSQALLISLTAFLSLHYQPYSHGRLSGIRRALRFLDLLSQLEATLFPSTGRSNFST
jgi:hypothetical protein